MPYKKASHRKVRTGCIQCKRRRVKVRVSRDVIPLLLHFSATAEANCFTCPVWPPRVFFLGLQAPTSLDHVNS
ncbi:uncharacterized protein K444DRAFT_619208 [Hyaloscypha bicolor E]|uniref:Uncharacterized protein n=1 Tax=Hyaloscypha bicolor E TaxID=1095630 RepID=A0A2J6SRS0_9HELO|nr:uncharacterized protein K444DRAFT_619208 [Hyaloscypha bicolor E]PMD53440.1 hypothetical protein K444DRAFT_619208 [Hyaloscypha bicolor E]